MKSIPHLKISEDDLFDIEKKLNTVYELNKNDFLEKNKEIKEFKKIYQNLFEQNERFFSYDIIRITKEINEQFLSLKFKDFFSFLSTILQNYDKQYDCGLKVNKFMDDIIKNSKKKEMIFNEIKNRNKIHEIIINLIYTLNINYLLF